MRTVIRAVVVLALLAAAAAAAGIWYLHRPLRFDPSPLEVTLRPGTSLKAAAREFERAGLPDAWLLPWVGRYRGTDRALKAGTYQVASGATLFEVLDLLASGKVALQSLTVVEGTTFGQLRQLLGEHPDVQKTLADVPDTEALRRIGASEAHPEGLFFPDTYRFAPGSTDVQILRLAYQTMRERLAAAWASRSANVPYASPYEALIMASIVEKETGRAADRPAIASVFVNRLRIGMRLQTDPTVIYGIGERFDGNLRRRDLDTDTPYNTYTRAGLPPSPIALPGQASIDAALKPASTPYLYFVARGDGTSEFSTNLADHNRAVNRYQRGGR